MKVVRGLAGGLMGMCVWLAGCGGGGGGGEVAPTALPTNVALSTGSAAEVGSATAFTTNVTGPTTGLKFAWDFGDGGTSTEAAPTHAYAAGGSYEVSLKVTNEAGTTRSTTMTVVASRMSVVHGSVCSGAQDTGWCWQRPTPAGGLIADVFFLDGSTGWAVGDAGLMLKTTDGGGTWTGQASGVSTRLTQVRFSDASNGWAVGAQATVLHTTDGGATWRVQAPGVATSYSYGGSTTLVMLSSQRAIATFDGNVTRSTVDGGEHWLASTITPRLVTPGGTMWAIDSSGLVKSTDLGQHTTTSLPVAYPQSIQSVDFADDLNGWATSIDYWNSTWQVWNTVDGGTTWQPASSNGLPPNTGGTVTADSDGGAWLVTGYALYRRESGGTAFVLVPPPDGSSFFYYYGALQFVGLNSLAVAANGGAYLTRDRGQTWAFLKVSEEQSYYTPRVQVAGNTLWLHYPERSYRSLDNGAHWQRVFGTDGTDNGGSILAAWFFDANKGIGYSPAGWVVETSDSGKTWTRKTLTGTNNYYYGSSTRLQFASATTGWLSVGSYTGVISKTIDGGTSWWAPLTPFDFGTLSDFHFIDDHRGWAVGASGAISVSSDGAQTWTRQTTLPYALRGIRFADENVGLVVGDGGILARTTDGGATWTPRASRVTDTLTRVTFIDAHTAWAVGINGAVTQSIDGGSTWTRVRVASTANLNDIFFLDPQHGWIVGSGGTVLATSDAGRSWQVQASGTDKNLNTAFFIDPRTGWVMGDGGSVLVTATGGN